MRVAKLCCQVEAEPHIVLDGRVTYFDVVRCSSLHDLLLQKRFNCRVEVCADILDENRDSLANASFKIFEIVVITKFEYFNLFVLS
jgi:hypothetical protein